MNPLAIIGLILPIIEQLPTIESGIAALVRAISDMHSGGAEPGDILSAVTQSLGGISRAIIANTPHTNVTSPLSQAPAA